MRLPVILANMEIMFGDIDNKSIMNSKVITKEEVKNIAGFDIIVPKYLPARFNYYGTFIQNNPGIPSEQIVRQVWYDTEKLEVLLVTQSKFNSRNYESEIVFTDKCEDSVTIKDIYS